MKDEQVHTMELSLWTSAVKSDEAALLEIHRSYVSPWCVYWVKRYLIDSDDALVRLLRETRAGLGHQAGFLKDWRPSVPLKNYLNRFVIPHVHLLVRETGRAGSLQDWEEDWRLRDQVITADPDAQETLNGLVARTIARARFLYLKSYQDQDLCGEFWAHILKADGKVLWLWRGETPLRAYLRGVICNLSRSLLRHELLDATQYPVRQREGEETDPADRLFHTTDPSLRVDLMKAILKLTQERDRIYLSSLLRGLSDEEAIAGLTTEKNRHNFRYNAKQRIRSVLLEMGIGL
jgi:hypothetical protein